MVGGVRTDVVGRHEGGSADVLRLAKEYDGGDRFSVERVRVESSRVVGLVRSRMQWAGWVHIGCKIALPIYTYGFNVSVAGSICPIQNY